MRIYIAHNEYGRFSGEEAVVEQVCALLEQNGHDVVRFIRSSADIASMWLGKTRALVSGIHNRSSIRALRRLLLAERPALVHVHNVYPLISPSVLAECRRGGVPVVMTIHNYRLVCPNGLHVSNGEVCARCAGGREYWCVLKNCERSLPKSLGYALRNYVARKRRAFLDNVTMYAALTEFQRQRLIEEGYPADRIVVTPNMAQVNGQSNGSPLGDYVAYVGRVSPEKGVSLLVEAARNLPRVKFEAAGAYDAMPELAEHSPANFRFRGHLQPIELTSFLANVRIVVLASTCFEGFPVTIAEAMLHGKPVVCSRIGGLPEIVDDGVTGLLFEPGNVDDLTAKIQHLWNHPDECLRMGQAGREKALREYSPDRYYQRLMAVYEKAITLGPGGPKRSTGTRRPVSQKTVQARESRVQGPEIRGKRLMVDG